MEKGNKKLHILDRYLGIPLIIFLGLFKKKNKPKNANLLKANKIAFLNLGSIGDTALLFGIIKDIKKRFPNSKIFFFAGSSNFEMAKLCPNIDETIKIKFSNPLKAINVINAEGKFDILFDCMPWPRISSIITAFSNADLKVGYKTKGQYRHYIYDIIADHSECLHELENTRNLIRWLNFGYFNFPSIKSDNLFQNEKIAIIHMYPSGFKSYLKKWPDDNWVKVIEYLTQQGFKIYLTGGKADHKDAEIFVATYSFENVISVAGKLKLKDTINLINSANIVISVNTGIMHLAACLQVNLIGLHGPTSAKRWGPINKNSFAINSSHKDAPCLHLGFEYKCGNINCNCMSLVSVDEVISKIKIFTL